MSTVSNVFNNAASSVSAAAGYQPASAPSGGVAGEVEQLLQDVENLMQQSSQGAGQTAGTQSTPQASTAQPTSGGMPTTGSNAMNGQSASGALAAYMGTNGDQSLNMNDLYKLSQGQAAGGSGQTPSPDVQQAAQYMLANPGVYNKIETNDVAGADGISGAANFENAAEGNIAGVTAGASQTAGTQSTPQASTAQPTSGGMPTTGSTGSNAMNGQSASGALAGYMGTNGDQSLNMNDLYKLSQGQAAGGSGQTPSPEVQQAAQYMLANPGVYNKIETNDVAGADGISGAANFQNAAEGNIAGVTAGPSQTAGTQSTPQASTAQPTSGGMPTTGSTGSNATNGQSASGALAAYMGTNGNQSLDMDDLYKLSQGQAAGGSGQTPSPEVQQAAQYMLANPGAYNKIETNDVAGADGISGAANFQNAAQGNIPGVAS